MGSVGRLSIGSTRQHGPSRPAVKRRCNCNCNWARGCMQRDVVVAAGGARSSKRMSLCTWNLDVSVQALLYCCPTSTVHVVPPIDAEEPGAVSVACPVQCLCCQRYITICNQNSTRLPPLSRQLQPRGPLLSPTRPVHPIRRRLQLT